MKKIDVLNSNGYYYKLGSKNPRHNDPKKYITVTKSDSTSDIEKVLLEFPEFINGYTATITNTGLVIFEDYDPEKAYDITDISTFDNLEPDFTSTSSLYTEFNNPLGVRRISVSTDKNLTGDIYYFYKDNNKYNNYIIAIDADKICIKETDYLPNDDGTFTVPEFTFNDLYFEYKQSMIVKFVNCKGTVNEKYIDSEKDIILDFSDITDTKYNKLEFSFTSVKSNAYVEIR